jgi:hypothetical protein
MRTRWLVGAPSLRGFAQACVTRGLDPRVHLLRKKMDRRVKPGDDDQTVSGQA